MATGADGHYLPPVDRSLSGDSLIISWRTVCNALLLSPSTIADDTALEHFLSESTSLLTRPYHAFRNPSPSTRQSFETRTAAINVTPSKDGTYNLDEIKADSLWLSKEAGIDESTALRVVLLEWQSRPVSQLLSGFTDEEAARLRDAAGGGVLAASMSMLSASSAISTELAEDGPSTFNSESRRRSRIVKQHLEERRYVLKSTELMVRFALSSSDSSEDSTWVERVGKTLVNARRSGFAGQDSKSFADECIDALETRIEAYQKGSFLGADDAPDVEVEWAGSMIIELIHILQLLFLDISSSKDITHSRTVLSWMKFASKYSFFDQFEPIFEVLRPLVQPLQSLMAVVSVAVLKVPESITYLEQTVQQSLSPSSSYKPYISDTAVFGEITDALVGAALAPVPIASPAVFAWGVLLQTMRMNVLSAKETREHLQSELAVEDLARADMSDTDPGEGTAMDRPPPRHLKATEEQKSYELALEAIMDTDLDEDPIELLAKAAVNGCQLFDVIALIARVIRTAFGAEGSGEASMAMRVTLLELIRASLPLVEYSSNVMSAILALLIDGTRPWEPSALPSRSAQKHAAAIFLADDRFAGMIMNVVYGRFPWEIMPLLKFAQATGSHGELDDRGLTPMVAALEHLESFSQVLPGDFKEYQLFREEENANLIALVQDLKNFTSLKTGHPIALMNPLNRNETRVATWTDDQDGSVVPTGTRGRIILESTPPVAQWFLRFSGLKYLSKLLETALPNSDIVETATGHSVDRYVIAEIITVFTTLLPPVQENKPSREAVEAAQIMLSEASNSLDRNRDIISTVFDIFEGEIQLVSLQSGSDGSLEVLISCVGFILALLPFQPGRVWPLFARSSLLELNGNGGKLAAIVAGVEMNSGRYDFLIGCIRIFQSLVDDAVRHSVARRGAVKEVGRFQGMSNLGTGVPDKIMRGVLLSFERTMVDVFESVPSWRFQAREDKLEIRRTILSTFNDILLCVYGIDDSNDISHKLTSPLDTAATYLVDVFLSSSANSLAVQPLLGIIFEGIDTPNSSIFFVEYWSWISQIVTTLKFSRTLLKVGNLLNREPSRYESEIFKITPVLVRVYAAHESFRAPAVELLEAVITSAAAAEGEPPSLLGHLGPATAKNFLALLSRLGGPVLNEKLELRIWNLLAAVVSNRQQWFSVYLLSGHTPRDSLQKDAKVKATGLHPGKPLLTIALDYLSNISNLSPQKALALLEFISLAEDRWPWAMSTLQTHPKFLTAISDYVNSLEVDVKARALSKMMDTCYKMKVAASIAEILAMSIHHSRELGAISLAKKLIPKITFYVKHAVSPPEYNTSLHSNLRINIEAKFPGCTLGSFKRTQLGRASFGENYFYDLKTADRMLSFDKSWSGVSGEGLSGEVSRANINLSLVESQVSLLRSWKLLAIELSNLIPSESQLRISLARVVHGCLESNKTNNLPEPMSNRLVQTRADFAFILMQRLAEVKTPEKEIKALLAKTWDSIRSSGTNFELALVTGDATYYRSLLKILFLAIHTQLRDASAQTSAPKDALYAKEINKTQQTILEIVELVVARGFRELATTVHEHPASSSPEDIALVTAILQSALRVSAGVESLLARICACLADTSTARVATTLFSWADKLAIDGDPVYGELAILFLLELSSIPTMAEQLALEGVFAQLSNAGIMAYYRKGTSHPRLRDIWARGLLPLCLNVLSAVGPPIAPEIATFLNQYSGQLSLASQAFDGKLVPAGSAIGASSDPPITYSIASEAHSLALISRILSEFRDRGAATGVRAEDIPPLDWDAAGVKEDVEGWLLSRGKLRDRLLPATEKEAEWAREKAIRKGRGAESRLEEKIVGELEGVVDVLGR